MSCPEVALVALTLPALALAALQVVAPAPAQGLCVTNPRIEPAKPLGFVLAFAEGLRHAKAAVQQDPQPMPDSSADAVGYMMRSLAGVKAAAAEYDCAAQIMATASKRTTDSSFKDSDRFAGLAYLTLKKIEGARADLLRQVLDGLESSHLAMGWGTLTDSTTTLNLEYEKFSESLIAVAGAAVTALIVPDPVRMTTLRITESERDSIATTLRNIFGTAIDSTTWHGTVPDWPTAAASSIYEWLFSGWKFQQAR